MITVLNRKELYTTFDMGEQEKIKQILDQNQIPYTTKTINRKSPSAFSSGSRVRTGTFGESTELEYEYIIFVKKEDYERASSLIR